jgi:hypothetical protein
MTKTVHLLPVLAGAAIALLSCAGLAVYVGWIPAAGSIAASVRTAKLDPLPTACGRCGIIEAVRESGARAAASSAGTVTGAPLSQQLVGFSRDLTNFVGLLMVATAGRPTPEPGVPALREIAVRFEDGSSRVLVESNPSWQPGDRVKVVNGRLQARALEAVN